ncbi:MAG: 2-succinyl-5-enolpyruvyl-6-hydroxy-3-cyclohexene-1-carboxylic-acid synthase [Flavobacteriaceae bacterium]|nr:2-succinyl-5-enolpyruvyl-6-hydroxy-3-cyclohexene-1-carboxylic-acid synthase [Flavobacteriaceae bacterium]
MSYPKNELAQLVIAYCVAYNIKDVIISPGSRNAPLTIGFVNHPNIETYSIADERCAAFYALGIAQQKRKPVALVCTSGSALLNYYPAFAEAYYSDIPLLVISADRPKHLIDIGDGQTIRQENVFENHSLFNANLSAEADQGKKNSLILQRALKCAIQQNGPVHINVPFDEPLYETVESISFEIFPKMETESDDAPLKLSEYSSFWNRTKRKMILVGTHYPDQELQELLAYYADDPSVIVLTETTSNLHHVNFINSIDKIIMPLDEIDFEKLHPTIVLTFGGMIVSKKIKQLLRKFQPERHWHVDPKRGMDTFFCLSYHFKTSAIVFFKEFNTLNRKFSSTYQQEWLQLKYERNKKHDQYVSEIKFSDLKMFNTVLNSIPDRVQLQLGNSSVIRYAQLFDLKSSLSVFCNRGTSGIDGSTSTAIGASQPTDKQTIFITGDISFFYDSNALWNDYIKNDFRIIVINNSGGGIFRILPGPQSTNALNYFESPHDLNASHLCTMYGFDYECAVNMPDLNSKLSDFFTLSDQPKLLEIFTPREENDKVLKNYFNYLK